MRKIQIIGNIGKDAVYHKTEKGGFISFSVAAQAHSKGETLWVTCNKNGSEALAPHLKKGTKVFVQGDVSLRSYTDKQGQQRTELTCYVDFVEFCGSKPEQTQQAKENFIDDLFGGQVQTNNESWI